MFDKGLFTLRAKAKSKYERESYVASKVILRKFDALFG